MASDGKTVRIGCAGWSIPRQYADGIAGNGAHLERYSLALNCAEINSSFYRSHRLSTWSRWAESVPDDFLFSVKAPKAITHEAKLDCSKDSEEQLDAFLAEARTLGNKLGPILFQLPPGLKFDQARATAFLKMLRKSHLGLVALEPRHESWFTSHVDTFLREFEIARVAADPAVVPEASRAGGSTALIYHRLHGSPHMYYSAYDRDDLDALAALIRSQCLASEVWCIFDNTASGAALGNALALGHSLAADQRACTMRMQK